MKKNQLIWNYVRELNILFYTNDRFFQMLSFNNFCEETFLMMIYDYCTIQYETEQTFILDEIQLEYLAYEYKESTVMTQLLLEDLATIEAISTDGSLVYNLSSEGEYKFDLLMF